MGGNISVDESKTVTEITTVIMNETYNEFKTIMSQKIKVISEQQTKINNTQEVNIVGSKVKDVEIKQNGLIDICQKITTDMQSYLNTLSTMISKEQAQQDIQDTLNKAAQSASDSFQLAVNSSKTSTETKQKLETSIKNVNSIVNDINLQFESYVKNGTEMNLEQIVNIIDSEVEDVAIVQDQAVVQQQEQETTQKSKTDQGQTTTTENTANNSSTTDKVVESKQEMTNKGLIAVAIVVLVVAIIVFYFYIQYQKKKATGGMGGMGRRYQQLQNSLQNKIRQFKK